MDQEQKILSLCHKILQSVKPPLREKEGSEVVNEEATAEKCETDLSQLFTLLKGSDKGCDVSCLAVVTIVAAGHCGKHYWTTTVSRKTAHDVVSRLVEVTGSESVERMLAGGGSPETEGMLTSVLVLIRKKLTKEQWKQYPVHKQALVWCVKQLKHPNVSVYLDTFLPATLMMLDDYTDYHRVLALGLASHIISNVDPTELRWYNRADVLYQAIKPLLYGSAPEVSNAVYNCLLHLLPVLDQYQTEIPAKPNKSAEVFDILLDSLQTESKLARQKVFASYLSKFIEYLGIFTVRHMKLLVEVLVYCIKSTSYPETRSTQAHALHALATLITHTWPRIPHHKDAILKCLVQVVLDLCSSASQLPQDKDVLSQLNQVSKCFELLKAACPDVEEHYKILMSDCSHHAGLMHCLSRLYN